MIASRKEFFSGVGLIVCFFIILIMMFLPIFRGHNALEYLDALYNSISKGSAYYIPKVKEEIKPLSGTKISVTLAMTNETRAKETVYPNRMSLAEHAEIAEGSAFLGKRLRGPFSQGGLPMGGLDETRRDPTAICWIRSIRMGRCL